MKSRKRRKARSKPNTAVCYCRVSTPRQVENGNLVTQSERVLRVCRDMDLEVLREFVDKGKSGWKGRRDSFNEMMKFCKTNRDEIGYLVVYDTDRFSRNLEDFLFFSKELMQLDITLHICDMPSGDTPEGKMVRLMRAVYGNYFSDNLAKKTRQRMQASREKGRWCHQAPVGYVNNPVRKASPSLLEDRNRGPLLKTLFEDYASGKHTQVGALRRATRKGLRSKKGNEIKHIRQILTNPAYAGYLEDPRTGELLRGDWTPLVSETLFEKVRTVLDTQGKRPTPHNRDNEDFPLKSTVKCQECGANFTGAWSRGKSKSYAYYRCFRCGEISVRKEKLEQAFMQLLGSLQPTKKYVKDLRKSSIELLLRAREQRKRERVLLKKRLRDLSEKRRQLNEAHIYEKTIPSDVYDEESKRLRRETRILREELDRLPKRRSYSVPALVDVAMHNLVNLRAQWERGDLYDRRHIQESVFPEGLKFDGEEFKTPVTTWIVNDLQAAEDGKTKMASPRGFEPLSPP